MATAVGGGLGGMEWWRRKGDIEHHPLQVEKTTKTTLCGRSAADSEGTDAINRSRRSIGGGGIARRRRSGHGVRLSDDDGWIRPLTLTCTSVPTVSPQTAEPAAPSALALSKRIKELRCYRIYAEECQGRRYRRLSIGRFPPC